VARLVCTRAGKEYLMTDHVRPLRGLLGPLVFFVSVSFLAGCYTAFRHPGVPEYSSEPISHERSCYECHEESAFYHSYYGVDYGYYGSPWFGYYSDPWWFNSKWHYDDSGEPHPLDSESRQQWSRGVPTGSARGAEGSSSTAPYLREGYSRKASDKPAKPDTTQEKKEDQKSKDRRTYGRGNKK
jgi:hypothetical protein